MLKPLGTKNMPKNIHLVTVPLKFAEFCQVTPKYEAMPNQTMSYIYSANGAISLRRSFIINQIESAVGNVNKWISVPVPCRLLAEDQRSVVH